MLNWLLKLFRRNPRRCERCKGCGFLASTALQEPWSDWAKLPICPAYIFPIPCPECNSDYQKHN